MSASNTPRSRHTAAGKSAFVIISERDNRRYRLLVKESALPILKISSIKKNLAKSAGIPPHVQQLYLATMPHRELGDTVVGREYGLCGGMELILRIKGDPVRERATPRVSGSVGPTSSTPYVGEGQSLPAPMPIPRGVASERVQHRERESVSRERGSGRVADSYMSRGDGYNAMREFFSPYPQPSSAQRERERERESPQVGVWPEGTVGGQSMGRDQGEKGPYRVSQSGERERDRGRQGPPLPSLPPQTRQTERYQPPLPPQRERDRMGEDRDPYSHLPPAASDTPLSVSQFTRSRSQSVQPGERGASTVPSLEYAVARLTQSLASAQTQLAQERMAAASQTDSACVEASETQRRLSAEYQQVVADLVTQMDKEEREMEARHRGERERQQRRLQREGDERAERERQREKAKAEAERDAAKLHRDVALLASAMQGVRQEAARERERLERHYDQEKASVVDALRLREEQRQKLRDTERDNLRDRGREHELRVGLAVLRQRVKEREEMCRAVEGGLGDVSLVDDGQDDDVIVTAEGVRERLVAETHRKNAILDALDRVLGPVRVYVTLRHLGSGIDVIDSTSVAVNGVPLSVTGVVKPAALTAPNVHTIVRPALTGGCTIVCLGPSSGGKSHLLYGDPFSPSHSLPGLVELICAEALGEDMGGSSGVDIAPLGDSERGAVCVLSLSLGVRVGGAMIDLLSDDAEAKVLSPTLPPCGDPCVSMEGVRARLRQGLSRAEAYEAEGLVCRVAVHGRDSFTRVTTLVEMRSPTPYLSDTLAALAGGEDLPPAACASGEEAWLGLEGADKVIVLAMLSHDASAGGAVAEVVKAIPTVRNVAIRDLGL
ncbi:hypothetical protein KIPB_004350 [Kipferlia bialata]|uniref:Ubiquitin-like domain-containing protein n=1 Tax=Kipferlia bialata TaxID=797122 RepID=A0A9K3CTK8_9EUKA|nr:hypothetical protein KIPB_004350 [Kipferlia bialata]|eukprot:g4350.t1